MTCEHHLLCPLTASKVNLLCRNPQNNTNQVQNKCPSFNKVKLTKDDTRTTNLKFVN